MSSRSGALVGSVSQKLGVLFINEPNLFLDRGSQFFTSGVIRRDHPGVCSQLQSPPAVNFGPIVSKNLLRYYFLRCAQVDSRRQPQIVYRFPFDFNSCSLETISLIFWHFVVFYYVVYKYCCKGICAVVWVVCVGRWILRNTKVQFISEICLAYEKYVD